MAAYSLSPATAGEKTGHTDKLKSLAPSLITLLGTGNNSLTPKKLASSVLLDINGTKIVYDFGHGTAQRLAEIGLKQNDVQHIIIGHHNHPDHISDLIPYLHAASWSDLDRRTVDVNLYGPAGLANVVTTMQSLYDPGSLDGSAFNIIVHELPTDGPFTVAGNELTWRDLHHAHGIKFSYNTKTIAITGDFKVLNNTDVVDFLRDSDIAIIDAGHNPDALIVDLAVATNARRIICTHFTRDINIVDLNKQARDRGFTGTLELGHELQRIAAGLLVR